MSYDESQENLPPSLVGPNDKYYRLRDVLEEVFHSSPDESIIYHEEDFEELELLGEGVSSYVQKVRRKSDNQLFAMKVIHLDYDSESKNALISGMKILKQINNPYIIKYNDCFIDYGNLSVLLEYMDNGSLRDKINERIQTSTTITTPLLPYCEIKHIAKSVLLGLSYLHKLNIIHRDIKADNILLNKNNDIKISDFGCSTTFNVNDDLLEDQHGTTIYMSPELIKGTGHNHKTDIFSFGLMIYECVTGKFIFHYLTDEEIGYWGLYNRYESEDPFIDVEFPCTDECKDFIKKCLIINFQERWDALQLLVY